MKMFYRVENYYVLTGVILLGTRKRRSPIGGTLDALLESKLPHNSVNKHFYFISWNLMSSNGISMPVTDEARVTARNLSALFVMKVIQYPFLFLFLVFVPRLMGPEIYGKYALFISIVMIATSLTDFGGPSEIFGRFVPEFEIHRKPNEIKKLFGNILFLQNTISLLAGTALIATLYLNYKERFSIIYFIFVLFIVIVRNNYSVYYSFLYGLNDLFKSNFLVPLRRILSLIFLLVLYHYFGFLGAVASTLGVDFCLAMPALYWTRNYFSRNCIDLDMKFLKPYLSFGAVFYLSGGLFTIWQKLGNIFIERMTHSTREVAIFDIPNQLFLLVIAFILAFNFALAPILTKLSLDGKGYKVSKWSSMAAKYMGILCTITFFGFAITGERLLDIAVGSDYSGSYKNGVIQLAGIFPLIVVYLGVLFSMVYKEQFKYFASLVIAILFFVIAAIILIPRYGSTGCAIAMTISCFAQAVVMFYLFKERLVLCLPALFKTIGFGLIFLLLLWMKQGLAISIMVFAGATVLYILLLFASKVLTTEEFHDILRAMRKKREPLDIEPTTSSSL